MIRPVAVEVILGRLHEYAVPERVAALHGVVRFDLSGGAGCSSGTGWSCGAARSPSRHRRRRAGRRRPHHQPAAVRPTDQRERNAGLEYLAGTLDIQGDAALAIGLAASSASPAPATSRWTPPARPGRRRHRPRDVPLDHLKKVMASDFRPVVLGEIFRRLPDYLNQRKARDVDLTVASGCSATRPARSSGTSYGCTTATCRWTPASRGRSPTRPSPAGLRLPAPGDRPPQPGDRGPQGAAPGARGQGQGPAAELDPRHPEGALSEARAGGAAG